MYPKRQWKARFTPSEFCRGWVFFALYLLVFPLLMGWLQMLLSQRFQFFLQAPEFSLIYYFLLLCATLLLFWSFLRQGFDILLDDLPENLTAFLAGLVGGGVLQVLFSLLPLPVEDPNPASYAESFFLAPAATVAVLVLLMPIMEEVLFRGLLFGSLRRYSRGLAFRACLRVCSSPVSSEPPSSVSSESWAQVKVQAATKALVRPQRRSSTSAS